GASRTHRGGGAAEDRTLTTTDDEILEGELAAEAREDPVTFNDLVVRDERGGGPIVSCPMHEEWHVKISKHPRLQILSHIESGKSVAVAVGRVLYELGRNPDLRVAIVCNTSGQAAKLLGLIGHYAEHSAELRRVFPNLRPDPAGPWNSTALAVLRS